MVSQNLIGECAICFSSVYSNELDNPQRFYSTPCNHHFHFECLQRWCQTNNNCPTCRFNNVMNIPNYIQDENLLPPVSQQMIREPSIINQVDNYFDYDYDYDMAEEILALARLVDNNNTNIDNDNNSNIDDDNNTNIDNDNDNENILPQFNIQTHINNIQNIYNNRNEPLVTRQLAFDNNTRMRPRIYNMLPITSQFASNNSIEVD
tara:strand:- start:4979 stop:5596 length:618 start_codon:yes stop_codon:yes gene_type:complete